MLSCEVNGELRYIRSFKDFEECMEPSVYKAVEAFFGESDAKEGNFISRIEDLESRIWDLENDLEKAEDDKQETSDEVERLTKRNEELEKEIELTEKYKEALNAIWYATKEALTPNDKPTSN